MKLNNVLLGLILSASTSIVLATDLAPVINVNSNNQTSSQAQAITYSGQSSTISEQLTALANKLDSRNRAQVNIQRQLDELQTEVNELRGVTELHTHQLSQVLERQRELYQELDRRVADALKPASLVPTSIAVNAADTQLNQAQDYSTNLTENDAYDRALNLVLKDKRYEEAIVEFRAFNENFSQSSYAANAHYWLGQLLFNKSELVEAEKEFLIVVEQFKESAKRPDAMLKLAMVAQKENSLAKAKQLYNLLLAEYPDSTSAQLAQSRLENIN